MKTRRGRSMNSQLRQRIIQVMTRPDLDGATQKELADAAGIHPRTLRDYLTPDLWEEVKERRLMLVHAAIGELDRTILAKALAGDLAAAKLIYSRWDKAQAELQAETEAMQAIPGTLAEVEAELEQLRTEVAALEEGEE